MGRDRACAAVLDASGTRVLMVLHRQGGREFWTLPGGGRAPGETLAEAAVRETREETGAIVEVARPLVDETYLHQGRWEWSRCFLAVLKSSEAVSLGVDPEEAHNSPDQRMLAAVAWRALGGDPQTARLPHLLHQGAQELLEDAEDDPRGPLRPIQVYRVHTADCAWTTQKPRGLFVAVGRLVEAGTLTPSETAQYWDHRRWFEAALPVPPFYAQGNPQRAITWFKNNPQGTEMEQRMSFYREMAEKYGLPLYQTSATVCPGSIVYEDEFQMAVVDSRHEGPGFLVEPLRR